MDYIAEIKAFYDLVMTKRLSTGQIALWHALMSINNRCAWQEWFSVPNLTLELNTGLSRSGVLKARNALKQHSVIDFKPNGTRATIYTIISNSTQDSTQVGTQVGTQISTQDSTQISTPLYKEDIDTTPNDSLAIKRNKKDICAFFEEIWALYPLKRGKGQVSDTKKAKLHEVGFDQLSRCIERYKASKPEWQAYQNGSTFFNSGYVDYLDANFSRLMPDAPKNGDRREDGRVFLDGKWVQV